MIAVGRCSVFGLLILVMAASASGQDAGQIQTRFSVGGSFIVSQPKEEFRLNVGNGYGGNGTVMYHVLRSGLVNLRFDISGVQYDSEKIRVPISETIGGRILVDLTTRNSIIAMSWG